jgi:3-oxoacyl-[acyl-carrier protein] reductase
LEADVSPTQKVALVTGAAKGLGAATARRLAHDGYDVGVLDLDESACAETVSAVVATGRRAVALAADVGDADAVRAAVTQLAEDLGGPTVLVNNAGITRDNLLFKMTEDDWDAVLRTHLRGAFLVTRAVQGFMTEAKWGRIVNLSSTSALGNRGQVNYAAAKAGMQGFTKTLAIELGPFGVTANAIAPGFIATDMTAATAERLKMSVEDFHQAAAQEIPLRRVGRPEDVAAVVSFLASEDASYVSGQVIYVAGGPKA